MINRKVLTAIVSQLFFNDTLSSLEGVLIKARKLKKLEISTPFIRCDILARSLKRLK